MRPTKTRQFFILIWAVFVFVAVANTARAEDTAAQAASTEKGLQHRIDFGNSYILGQSIKSGAVYLLHRKQSEIKGMLQVRQNFREEIKAEYGLEKTALVVDEGDAQRGREKK